MKASKIVSNPFSTTRRTLLKALPAIAFSPMLMAQQSTPVAVRKLHSFDLKVSDVDRSLQFYQELFAAPIQARQGNKVCLRIGDGPHFFSLSLVQPGQQPGFSHIGLSVADFAIDRVRAQLEQFGVTAGIAPTAGQAALESALHSWVITRGADSGGSASGTRDLFFADLEGLVYQLSPEDYCGGSGDLGTVCERIENAAADGLFKLVDLSHFTNFLANSARANEFFTRSFGKQFQAFQGPTSPLVGVGDGIQFLMYVGGAQDGPPTQPGRIDHVCFSVEDFSIDGIQAKLTDYGLTGRENGNNAPALSHWVSMRMPNRGGVEGGTPEVYFSDPDGIHIQLQDASYCGGGGYLGDLCEPLA